MPVTILRLIEIWKICAERSNCHIRHIQIDVQADEASDFSQFSSCPVYRNLNKRSSKEKSKLFVDGKKS